jgi:ribosome maturation factor RimP
LKKALILLGYGAILSYSYIRKSAEEWTEVHSSLLVRRKLPLTKRENYEQKTEKILIPIVEEYGFELVDVEYVKEGSTWYLRAYIDKPGGISIDDCEAVSRRLSDILDEKDYIDEAYILEVSSPGLGRPLKKEKDFKRSLGEEVEIRTYRMIEKQKEFTGILKEYDEKTVTIEEDGGNVRTFEKSDIALIRLAFDF